MAALVRELAEAINTGPVEGREGLREDAISVLRDEIDVSQPTPEAPGTVVPPGSFNSFGIGIPLFLMGGVLIFLFPPVGLLMFAVATLVVAWGVGTTFLARAR